MRTSLVSSFARRAAPRAVQSRAASGAVLNQNLEQTDPELWDIMVRKRRLAAILHSTAAAAGCGCGRVKDFAPLGSTLKKPGFRTLKGITGQECQGLGLELRPFILTFRDLSRH